VADVVCHEAYHFPNVRTYSLVPLAVLAKIEHDHVDIGHRSSNEGEMIDNKLAPSPRPRTRRTNNLKNCKIW
jgi:hypothetical protein